MTTKRLIIVCAWLVAAAAVSSCAGDGVGPAMSPIDPFGTEPSSGGATRGGEPTGGATSLVEACARFCGHISSTCPGTESPDCTNDCASAAPPGCETEFRNLVLCVATAPLDCLNMSIDQSACVAQGSALSNCASGASGGGTGSGGASGTR